MKEKLLKELHKMIIAIVKANDADLEKIGARLVDIEKEFKKMLSPLELELVHKWIYDDKFSYEQIYNAILETLKLKKNTFRENKYFDKSDLPWMQKPRRKHKEDVSKGKPSEHHISPCNTDIDIQVAKAGNRRHYHKEACYDEAHGLSRVIFLWLFSLWVWCFGIRIEPREIDRCITKRTYALAVGELYSAFHAVHIIPPLFFYNILLYGT